MKLTGKCKKAFKIWYEESMNHTPIMLPYNSFMGCHNSIKFGVFVDFFDHVNIYIMDNIFSIEKDIAIEFIGQIETSKSIWNSIENTRSKSRLKAIQKANQLLNNKLNLK